MEQETALASFMGVTGASESEARFLLEASGWKVDAAVSQFFDVAPTKAKNMSSDFLMPDEEDEVRAPDRAKQQRLLDSRDLLGVPHTASTPSAFADFRGDDDDDDEEVDDDESMREEAVSKKKPSTSGLAKLFAAPTKLTFAGDFQSARRRGKEEQKWLLISIVDESTFENAEMNRDVWSHETVQAVVESQFVLWMRSKLDREAIVYADRYDRESLTPSDNGTMVHQKHPHLAVLDPRTGRRLWQKNGKVSADALIEHLTDVADRHSMEESPSLPPPPPQHIPPPLPPLEKEEKAPWSSLASPADALAGVVVQLRLVTSDNKPITKKRFFDPQELVGSLFKFAQTETDAGEQRFELRFGYPPQQLWPLRDLSVSEAKLNGQAIQMKFL